MPPSILISSSGRRVELWRLFENATSELGLDWNVIGIDAAECSATKLVAGNVIRVPLVGDPGWREAVDTVVAENDVRLIVPTLDVELSAYATLRWRTRCAISDPATVDIANDKLAMHRWALDCGMPVPHTTLLRDTEPFEGAVVKPRHGSSSIGLQLHVSRARLVELAKTEAGHSMIAQEALHGPEFSVNCFVTRGGTRAFVIPHERLRTRAGEVSHAKVQRARGVEELADRVASLLPGAYGPLCIQIIDDSVRGPTLVEVNARFGGGYPLAHHAGARAPQRLLFDAIALPYPRQSDDWEADWQMFRYDESAFCRLG